MVPARSPLPPSSGLAALAAWCVVLVTMAWMVPVGVASRAVVPPMMAATALALVTALAGWVTRRDSRVWHVLTVSLLVAVFWLFSLT